MTGKKENVIKFVKDRPGHDRRCAIDNIKITSLLGWERLYTFENGLEETVRWYIGNKEWNKKILQKYYDNITIEGLKNTK